MERKKEKVLVVTTQYIHNYGAVLQAIAFKSFLEQNFNVDVVFLQPPKHKNRIFEKIFPISTNTISAFLNNAIKSIHIKDLTRKKRSFDLFIKENFSVISDEESEQFDFYITGGDQMFNRGCLSRPQNLLAFVDESVKKISYSTSMGSARFSDKEWEYLTRYFNQYSYLSLREESAKALLDVKINTPTRVDIDPTFLVDISFWNDMADIKKRRIPQKYILVYELMSHKDLNKVILEIKKKYKLPVIKISFSPKKRTNADYLIIDAGIEEFLWLFKNAEFVITTSFHGTCFSIINKKPFVSLVQKGEKRITNLLDVLDLSECCCDKIDAMVELTKPSFERAFVIIEQMKKEAFNYISRYLNK